MTTLTRVILEGSMGKEFGREWNLSVNSPAEALRLIDANHPGVFVWIKNNLNKYSRYRVIVDTDERDTDSFGMECKAKTIRFVPIIEGSGAGVRFVVGAIMAVVGYVFGWTGIGAVIGNMGVGLMMGAVTEWLSGTKDTNKKNDENTASTYFNGPESTERQGVPVPLIYGKKVLVGSHVVSSKMTINEVAI